MKENLFIAIGGAFGLIFIMVCGLSILIRWMQDVDILSMFRNEKIYTKLKLKNGKKYSGKMCKIGGGILREERFMIQDSKKSVIKIFKMSDIDFMEESSEKGDKE